MPVVMALLLNSQVQTLNDVIQTFQGYLSGTIDALPWFESPLYVTSQTF